MEFLDNAAYFENSFSYPMMSGELKSERAACLVRLDPQEASIEKPSCGVCVLTDTIEPSQ